MGNKTIDIDNFERNAAAALRQSREQRKEKARRLAGMVPIPDRMDMAKYAQEYFCQTGEAVEVGVFEGQFSAHNLHHWRGRYTMVDTWAHRPGDGQDKNDEDADYWKGIRLRATQNTGFAGDRRKIRQGYSVEVADETPNFLFDWVYLDAGHDYVNFRNDLEAWWPKLRPGGLFSGDDYGTGFDHPRLGVITAARLARKYGGIAEAYKWGTALALSEFCEARKLQLNITWLNDQANPAWYIIKPE